MSDRQKRHPIVTVERKRDESGAWSLWTCHYCGSRSRWRDHKRAIASAHRHATPCVIRYSSEWAPPAPWTVGRCRHCDVAA